MNKLLVQAVSYDVRLNLKAGCTAVRGGGIGPTAWGSSVPFINSLTEGSTVLNTRCMDNLAVCVLTSYSCVWPSSREIFLCGALNLILTPHSPTHIWNELPAFRAWFLSLFSHTEMIQICEQLQFVWSNFGVWLILTLKLGLLDFKAFFKLTF